MCEQTLFLLCIVSSNKLLKSYWQKYVNKNIYIYIVEYLFQSRKGTDQSQTKMSVKCKTEARKCLEKLINLCNHPTSSHQLLVIFLMWSRKCQRFKNRKHSKQTETKCSSRILSLLGQMQIFNSEEKISVMPTFRKWQAYFVIQTQRLTQKDAAKMDSSDRDKQLFGRKSRTNIFEKRLVFVPFLSTSCRTGRLW